MKSFKLIAAALIALLLVGGIGIGEILSNSGKLKVDAAHKVTPWEQETLKLAAAWPVQEGGRVKPLESYANTILKSFHGTLKLRLAYTDETKRVLKPIEWLMDTLFYPEAARHYPLFVVDDPSAVELVGMTAHQNRRQRYSWAEIEPQREQLKSLAQQYSKIEANKRTAAQTMIVNLAQNAIAYEQIIKSLDWARQGLAVQPENAPPLLKNKAENGRIKLSVLAATLKDMGGALSFDDVPAPIREAAMLSTMVGFYPPQEKEKTEWTMLGHQIIGGLVSPTMRDEAIKNMANWETLVRQRDQRADFAQTFHTMQSEVVKTAQERGVMFGVKTEQHYNKADLYYRALILFVVAFLMLAVSWILPPEGAWSRWLVRGVWALGLLALVAMTASMVMRAMIVRRPPITNLYETIPFITYFAVLVGLIIEKFTRRGIMLAVSVFLGAVGLFVTMKYEIGDASDTLAPLQAVLDTNFWLATHVTTINVGYSAGLLAAAISALYLVSRLFDPYRRDAGFYKVLNTATYGAICFGLLFSLIGTVLGGLWANDSWGRFWGWDPKENGALMIVLAMLIILHARLAGWIREFGLHQLSLLTGAIVAFSWWHVNLLGVGLHSYGFTAGIKNVVFGFYGFVVLVSFLGLLAWILEKMAPSLTSDESPSLAASSKS